MSSIFNSMKERTVTRTVQNLTRLAILVFATYVALMHQLKGVLVAPNAHIYCPFGGLESLYKLIISGGYITKIMPATMVLLVTTIVLAILLNRAFCGWICPLGTLQTIFDRLARAENQETARPADGGKIFAVCEICRTGRDHLFYLACRRPGVWVL